MKETFFEFLKYIKNPVLEEDKNLSLKYRFNLLFKIFLFCLIVGFVSTPLYSLFEELEWISLENHKVEEIFKDLPFFVVILIGGIIVPFFEELIFRAPITLFKNPKYFKIAFYSFAIIFGLIHITNFESTTTVYLLAPLLVIPQLFAGLALGFLRVKLGLQWSILLHCVYNIFFLSIGLLSDI